MTPRLEALSCPRCCPVKPLAPAVVSTSMPASPSHLLRQRLKGAKAAEAEEPGVAHFRCPSPSGLLRNQRGGPCCSCGTTSDTWGCRWPSLTHSQGLAESQATPASTDPSAWAPTEFKGYVAGSKPGAEEDTASFGGAEMESGEIHSSSATLLQELRPTVSNCSNSSSPSTTALAPGTGSSTCSSSAGATVLKQIPAAETVTPMVVDEMVVDPRAEDLDKHRSSSAVELVSSLMGCAGLGCRPQEQGMAHAGGASLGQAQIREVSPVTGEAQGSQECRGDTAAGYNHPAMGSTLLQRLVLQGPTAGAGSKTPCMIGSQKFPDTQVRSGVQGTIPAFSFPRPSPVSVLDGVGANLFSPAESEGDLSNRWESPVPFPLPPSSQPASSIKPTGAATFYHRSPLGTGASVTPNPMSAAMGHSFAAEMSPVPFSLPPAQSVVASQSKSAGNWSPARTCPVQHPFHPQENGSSPENSHAGAADTPWSSLKGFSSPVPSPAKRRLGRGTVPPAPLSPVLVGSPVRVPFSPIQSAAGSQSGNRISARLRQRLEQAKDVQRHAAPECCSTPPPQLPLHSPPARSATPGRPSAAFEELLEAEASKMQKQRQLSCSPRVDCKRPKVEPSLLASPGVSELTPTHSASEQGRMGSPMLQRSRPPRGSPVKAPSPVFRAPPSAPLPRRSPLHRNGADEHQAGIPQVDSHLMLDADPLCMGRSPSMGGPPAGSNALGLQEASSPGASPVKGRKGPRRTPSFSMLPPAVFSGSSADSTKERDAMPPPTAMRPRRPALLREGIGEGVEEGGKCVEIVRRLGAIQEWEEDAVSGDDESAITNEGRALQTQGQMRVPLWGGRGTTRVAPQINVMLRRDSDDGGEEEEPQTPCTPCDPSAQVSTGFLECPEAPHWRRKEMARCSSLKDTKLLLTTQLKRSHSVFLFDRHFEFIREIGRGSFSKVYEARDRRHGTLCAVKVSRREFRSKGERERFLHEVESVAGLEEHPNIVKYFRSWQQDSHLYIQMELCEMGSLRHLLTDLLELLREEDVWIYCRQLASGLDFIHKAGVLHLDIKPENIMVDKQGILKIGDFGQAVMDQRWDWEDGDGGYLAPELLGGGIPAGGEGGVISLPDGKETGSSTPTPTPAADMFSFGALMYELATGTVLPRSCLRTAATECLQGLTKAGRSPSLTKLISQLLELDPAARPTADQVLTWEEQT